MKLTITMIVFSLLATVMSLPTTDKSPHKGPNMFPSEDTGGLEAVAGRL